MASRRPMRRSSSSTACCWAALENAPEGCTQAPSQAALGVRAASVAGLEGGKARAETVRAPTRPASSTRAMTTREGGRRAVARGGRGGGGGGGGGGAGGAGSRTKDATGDERQRLLLLGERIHQGREVGAGAWGRPRLPGGRKVGASNQDHNS